MKIKIVFDKAAGARRLYAGWGLSVLIGGEILFDTGENGPWLIENMKNLEADIAGIKGVVISHEHWDHVGGLWDILDMKFGLPVYACPGFGAEFKCKVREHGGKLMETKGITEIADNIFVTGEIPGEYKGAYMPEQSAAVKTEKGITLITGCSHPGIMKIAEKVKKTFMNDKLNLALGGFHLLDKDGRTIERTAEKLMSLGFVEAAPTHCSGAETEKIFKKIYGGNFISVEIGQEIDV